MCRLHIYCGQPSWAKQKQKDQTLFSRLESTYDQVMADDDLSLQRENRGRDSGRV